MDIVFSGGGGGGGGVIYRGMEDYTLWLKHQRNKL